jgi:hypothetical protein
VAPKLMGATVAIDSLMALGWPTRYLFPIGIIELACILLFIVPRTSLLGAVRTQVVQLSFAGWQRGHAPVTEQLAPAHSRYPV